MIFSLQEMSSNTPSSPTPKKRKIEAYVTSTLPMKKAKNGQMYFEANIQLEDEIAKLVGFSANKPDILKEFEHNGTAFIVENAKKKKTRQCWCFQLSNF